MIRKQIFKCKKKTNLPFNEWCVLYQIEEELWEEEFIERCFQEMLEEEEHEWFIPARDLPQTFSQLQEQLNALVIGDGCMLNDIVVSQLSMCVLYSLVVIVNVEKKNIYSPLHLQFCVIMKTSWTVRLTWKAGCVFFTPSKPRTCDTPQ